MIPVFDLLANILAEPGADNWNGILEKLVKIFACMASNWQTYNSCILDGSLFSHNLTTCLIDVRPGNTPTRKKV